MLRRLSLLVGALTMLEAACTSRQGAPSAPPTIELNANVRVQLVAATQKIRELSARERMTGMTPQAVWEPVQPGQSIPTETSFVLAVKASESSNVVVYSNEVYADGTEGPSRPQFPGPGQSHFLPAGQYERLPDTGTFKINPGNPSRIAERVCLAFLPASQSAEVPDIAPDSLTRWEQNSVLLTSHTESRDTPPFLLASARKGELAITWDRGDHGVAPQAPTVVHQIHRRSALQGWKTCTWLRVKQ
jgi:hypothetical protein